MPITYVKFANVLTDITDGTTTRAAVLTSMAAGELSVVNLKGYILTVADFADGEEAGR